MTSEEGYQLLQYAFAALQDIYTNEEIDKAYPSAEAINGACHSYKYQVGGKGCTAEDVDAAMTKIKILYGKFDAGFIKPSIGRVIPLIKEAAKRRQDSQPSGLEVDPRYAAIEEEGNARSGLGQIVRRLADGARPGDVMGGGMDPDEEYDSIYHLPGVIEKIGSNRDEYLLYGDPRYGVEDVIRDDDDWTIVKLDCENQTNMIKIDWSKEMSGSPKSRHNLVDLMRKELGIPMPAKDEQVIVQADIRQRLIRSRIDAVKLRRLKAKQRRWEREEVAKCKQFGIKQRQG